MIIDKSVFLEHQKTITVDDYQYTLKFNLSTQDYYKILCLAAQISDAEDDREKMYSMAEATKTILKNANKKITTEWIIQHIETNKQVEIINAVLNYINGQLSDTIYTLPDVRVKKETAKDNKYAKKREEKRNEIARLTNILSKRDSVSLMDGIVYVMTKTANSYYDIMKMPILVFKAMIRALALNELRADDDYNIAYLKYETEIYRNEINSGAKAIDKPSESRGADLKKLKSLLGR